MRKFETVHLPLTPNAVAPDGSDVRLSLGLSGAGMAHFESGPNKVSKAVVHRTAEEIWLFLSGRRQTWRNQGGVAAIVDVYPGACITISLGTHFQFKSYGFEALSAVGVTIPPWPGESEASLVDGLWPSKLPAVSQ
jgi:mannose-6-phosphate isomerase-like protein (cupin superfamily)